MVKYGKKTRAKGRKTLFSTRISTNKIRKEWREDIYKNGPFFTLTIDVIENLRIKKAIKEIKSIFMINPLQKPFEN